MVPGIAQCIESITELLGIAPQHDKDLGALENPSSRTVSDQIKNL